MILEQLHLQGYPANQILMTRDWLSLKPAEVSKVRNDVNKKNKSICKNFTYFLVVRF